MNRTYDAVVVGAGPAGTTAAARLASSGSSVLLLEAKKLPRDKPCGGGLTPRAWRRLGFPIDDLVLVRCRSVRLRVGLTVSASVRSMQAEIWMVRRRDFDLRLAEEAARLGAEVHDCEPVIALETGNPARVVTDRGVYFARVVVGADGAESRVARWLGLSRPDRWMVGLEAQMASASAVSDEAVVDLSVPGGYAWAFPNGETWNVGVATFRRETARDLRGHLNRFVGEMAPTLVGRPVPVGHRIPAGLTPGPLHKGNALLVGDAAGVADPLFGEGISYAILSGRLAAEEVLAYLAMERPDLARYTIRLKSLLAADFRRWRLTAAFVHRFPEISVRILASSGWLQRLVERTIAGEVGSARIQSLP